jgi:hypothetical protein
MKVFTPMTALPDDEIKTVVRDVARERGIPAQGVSTTSFYNVHLGDTLEVVVSIPPGASLQWATGTSSGFVSTVIQRLADKGEERFPIVHYEEKSAP